ncbi:hypothetical protein IAR55_005164 [Kwoniella newhampshirensis]|uniref:Phytanoyl-CoA dioxygenase n=1 Tax=Kwoniella newhampshirensis TaxID=1651941 RepID=A0AAW0YWR7_9TREE
MTFTGAELDDLVEAYHTQGFVIVPNLIPPDLLPDLTTAADRVVDLARSGGWQQVRTVGKPFPPWNETDTDIWGVQNVMHPDLGERIFSEWYGSKDMLDVSARLMGVTVDDMQFELFNLLINPLHSSYALTWHRDTIKWAASPSEEAEALQIKHHGIQWNTALYDDDCLWAVPASHNRIRTEEERTAGETGGGGDVMPGAIKVELKKGETVFYNNNILHVGTYNPAVKRRTLHGSYGSAPPGDTSRAKGTLQHDIGYTMDPKFKDGLSEELQGMVDRLNAMQKLVEGQEVIYAQD